MKTVKAYKNPSFMMSPEARSIRMLCEYHEPLTRLQAGGVNGAIIFFGSARLKPHKHTGPGPDPSGPDYCAMASDLAEKMAAWTVRTHEPGKRYHFCTGGGPGIMEAGATGVARVDRSLNLALNISLPFEQSINEHVDAEHAFEFHYFFLRKVWVRKLAAARGVFPGGFGTLDELFEMLTLVQTGKAQPMPFVLFGKEFWNEVVNFEALARRGVISQADVDQLFFAETVDEAFVHLTRHLSDASSRPSLLL